MARALGISRQTVYNYFPGTGALLEAVAVRSAVRFSDRVAEHMAGMTDPVETMLEALAYTLDSLAEEKERGIRLFFTYDLSRATKRITSQESYQFYRDMLQRFDVDWSAVGMGDVELEEVGEYLLRIIELYMVNPGEVRTGDVLRAYLRRWVAPVLRSEVETHSRTKATAESPAPQRSRRRATSAANSAPLTKTSSR